MSIKNALTPANPSNLPNPPLNDSRKGSHELPKAPAHALKAENVPPTESFFLNTLNKVDSFKSSCGSQSEIKASEASSHLSVTATSQLANESTLNVSRAASPILPFDLLNAEDEAAQELAEERRLETLYTNINHSVDTFLDPYIRGEITPETEDRNRRSLSEILQEKYGSQYDTKAEYIALHCYLNNAVKGMYLHRAKIFEPVLRELLHEKSYDKYLKANLIDDRVWFDRIVNSKNYHELAHKGISTAFEKSKSNPKSIWKRMSPALVKLLFDFNEAFVSLSNNNLELPSARTLEQALNYNNLLPSDLDKYIPEIEEGLKKDFPNLSFPEGDLCLHLEIALNRINEERNETLSPDVDSENFTSELCFQAFDNVKEEDTSSSSH